MGRTRAMSILNTQGIKEYRLAVRSFFPCSLTGRPSKWIMLPRTLLLQLLCFVWKCIVLDPQEAEPSDLIYGCDDFLSGPIWAEPSSRHLRAFLSSPRPLPKLFVKIQGYLVLAFQNWSLLNAAPQFEMWSKASASGWVSRGKNGDLHPAE